MTSIKSVVTPIFLMLASSQVLATDSGPAPVPEPSSLSLLAVGMVISILVYRKNRK